MRRQRGSAIGAVILVLLMLVIGTIIGRALPLGPLSLHIGFSPLSVNLYVLSLSVSLATNVLGLVGAVAGLLIARFV